MSWWYHKRGGLCRPLPGGPYLPRVFEDPTCPAAVNWSDIGGLPATFPPDAHTHPWSDIEDPPECFEPCSHTHSTTDLIDVLDVPLLEPDYSPLTDPGGLVLYPPATLTTALARKVNKGREIKTAGSLTGGGDLSADRTLSLVNDSATPGPDKQYSTDGSGVRGWFSKVVPRFTFSQSLPLATWTITHNLGFRPRVAVDNLAGQAIMGDVRAIGGGLTQLEIRFGGPVAGIAYLG